MRIVFMGTPDFSVAALRALAEAGHEIVCVYSQPPRKSGRGQKRRPSPVQAYAESQGWTVLTPKNFRDPAELTDFAALDADIAVVVAYGLILPQALLETPRFGCLNIHASLLPRWRGAALRLWMYWPICQIIRLQRNLRSAFAMRRKLINLRRVSNGRGRRLRWIGKFARFRPFQVPGVNLGGSG